MNPFSRREFFRHGGLAAVGAAGLVLRADAQPTPDSGGLGNYARFVEAADKSLILPREAKLTKDNIEGPYYRKGAPFRAKITPPLEPGKVLVVSGRVWGLDSRKPLVNAVLDIWQANAKGRYDNDDPDHPPAADAFVNRARLLTDENGTYEYETVHPGAYRTGPTSWRPSHVHYLVRHEGYKPLITQLYFKGDPHNKTDDFIKESLIIDPKERKLPGGVIEVGTFDIILAAAKT